MCATSDFYIGKDKHDIYIGYFGASFNDIKFNGTKEENKEAIKKTREILNKYSKDDLVCAFIDMLLNGGEGQ